MADKQPIPLLLIEELLDSVSTARLCDPAGTAVMPLLSCAIVRGIEQGMLDDRRDRTGFADTAQRGVVARVAMINTEL